MAQIEVKLPRPVFRETPYYVDRENAINIDISPLLGTGPIIGKATFLIDEEPRAAIIAADLESGRIWIECPGVGVAMVDIADLGHAMIHVLANDAGLCEEDIAQRESS